MTRRRCCGRSGFELAGRVQRLKKEEFILEVRNSAAQQLGAEYEVKIQTVRKNNNIQMQGLTVVKKGKNISPTVYLDSYYEAYKNGMCMREILETILQIIREETSRAGVDVNFLSDYESVRDRICFRLINEEKNRDILSEIPYLPFLDLAVCFFYPYEHREIGSGSILVRNDFLDRWGVSVQEIWRAAHSNTPRIFRPECCSMKEMISGIQEEKTQELPEPGQTEGDNFLFVLSNRQRIFGSSVLLYDGWPKKIARCFGKNYYILPSSIHEVILLPDSGQEDPEDLRCLIREVNRTQVEGQEVLSDSLYYYDCGEKNIRIIR